MTQPPTEEFENLCDKEFELARNEAYDSLDREVAEIRSRLASLGHVMSSAVGQSVLDAVLARYAKLLAAFEKVYLAKWSDSAREFADSDYEWLRAKAMSILPGEAQEAQSKCQNLLYEPSLFFQPWWQKTGVEAREKNATILKQIEILKLQKAQKMPSTLVSAVREETLGNKEPAVLISHSSKDKPLAEALIDLLRLGLSLPANQIRCTSVDGYRLPAGVNTDDELRKEIRTARVFVGLLTPNSVSSTYVLFELGARWGAELFLIPLLAGIKPEQMRGPHSVLNALSCESEAQLIQLVEDIGKELKIKPQSATSYLKQVRAVAGLAEAISSAGSAGPTAEQMAFKESVYWKQKDAEREGPYCPVCYDNNGKAIHLNPGATKGTYLCGVCQNGFRTGEYDARPARARSFS